MKKCQLRKESYKIVTGINAQGKKSMGPGGALGGSLKFVIHKLKGAWLP